MAACENPRRAYAAADGGRVRFFKPTDWQYHVEPYTGLELPCGVCVLCKTEQARQTAIRITHEATLHPKNSFVTLTYDDEHLPIYGALDYKDLADFWKRLRYHVGTLRYYAVGEYGEKTNRPHYHACIFGHDFYEGSVIIKDEPHRYWTSPLLTTIWGRGQVAISDLNHNNAAYTAAYVMKKQRANQRYCRIETDTGELVTVEAPRAFMSDNLAKGWWNQWNQGVTDWDRVIVNARPQKPPKAYDKWLKETNKEKMEEIKEKRMAKAKTKSKEQMRAHARNAHARAEEQKKKKSV